MTKKLHIQLKRWDYQCGDRCCYDEGTHLIVNGEELEHPDHTQEEPFDNSYLGEDVPNALRAVLKYLGIECEIEEINTYD